MNNCSCTPFMNHNSYHVFFTNLANPLKIEIITALKERGKAVGELSEELNFLDKRKAEVTKEREEFLNRLNGYGMTRTF